MTLMERTALVRQWLGLAWKLALDRWRRQPHLHRHAEPVDLFHEGVIGLMVAARRFDPARGAKFITHAYHWARWSVDRAARALGLIRLPDNIHRKVRETQEQDPLDEKWNQLLAKARAAQAVAAFPGDYDVTVSKEEEGRDVFELDRLAAALENLPERQAAVVAQRFGLDAGGGKATQGQIAQALGVTKQCVDQLEKKALRNLREWLQDGVDPQTTPLCRERLVGSPCLHPAVLDGYCAGHHPVHRLAAVQKRLEKLWERAEATGDWAAYDRHERQERRLLRQVDELHALRPALRAV
jgi:RNA polymerase sigma factor (sigma-70 family)